MLPHLIRELAWLDLPFMRLVVGPMAQYCGSQDWSPSPPVFLVSGWEQGRAGR